jgi:hypothetical protein
VPTITRQQLAGLQQQTGGGNESMGVWVNATTLWYTGTSGQYNYYELHRPSGSMLVEHIHRYRVKTEHTGKEFPRTIDQTKWRRVGSESPAYYELSGDGKTYILTTQPTLDIIPKPDTRPYDPGDLRP